MSQNDYPYGINNIETFIFYFLFNLSVKYLLRPIMIIGISSSLIFVSNFNFYSVQSFK